MNLFIEIITSKMNTLTAEELEEYKHRIPLTRAYKDDLPALPYRRREKEFKPNLHWGQRKLLLGEIEFLVAHGDKAQTVVYAGAAEGTHIEYLSTLFPTHKFILYDPRKFTIEPSNQIEIHTGTTDGFFTDNVARTFTNQKILFISDIRTGSVNPDDPDDDEFANEVVANMDMQRKWLEIMHPAMSMFKFRLPYTAGQTEYFDGTLLFQVWAPRTSTEGRLVCGPNPPLRIYDHTTYESIFYRFNTITRTQWHDHSINTNVAEGIDHCYDCAAEISILLEYLKYASTRADIYEGNKYVTILQNISEDTITNMTAPAQITIIQMSRAISRELSSERILFDPPHGLDPEVVFDEKCEQLAKIYGTAYEKRYAKKRAAINRQKKGRKSQ